MKQGLLVTGCGRSGTGFIAKVFEEAGFETGHERYFNVHWAKWPWAWQGVESSWLAAPFLKDVPDHVHVAHQVRHPVAVIRSFMGFEFFRTDRHTRYVSFAYRHAPSIQDWKDPLDKCLQYWVSWNEMIENHPGIQTHQLEQLSPEDLQTLGQQGGLAVSADTLKKACLKIGPRYHHNRRDEGVTAEKILERPLGPKVRELAAKYGYSMG